jgi:hypothetical protein
MPTLHAVVEGFSLEPSATWVEVPATRPNLLRLSADTPFDEVSLVVAQLCSYNSSGNDNRSLSLAELLISPDVVLPGGLAAVDDSRIIQPACCSGLEEWREWYLFLETGQQPWLGHDPSPWIQTMGTKYLVWSDGGLGEPQPTAAFSIEFERSELAAAIASAEADLLGFLEPLRNWAEIVDPNLGADLVRCFSTWFIVSSVA